MLPNSGEPPHHTRCYEGRAHITKQDVSLANHAVKVLSNCLYSQKSLEKELKNTVCSTYREGKDMNTKQTLPSGVLFEAFKDFS